ENSSWCRPSTLISSAPQGSVSTQSDSSALTSSSNLSGQMMSMIGTHSNTSSSFLGSTNHSPLFQPTGITTGSSSAGLLTTSHLAHHGSNASASEYNPPNGLIGSSGAAMDPSGWSFPSSKVDAASWNAHANSFSHENYSMMQGSGTTPEMLSQGFGMEALKSSSSTPSFAYPSSVRPQF
ncbi:hypothetical protein Anas_10285, partial [Armadillidium nasatum]